MSTRSDLRMRFGLLTKVFVLETNGLKRISSRVVTTSCRMAQTMKWCDDELVKVYDLVNELGQQVFIVV